MESPDLGLFFITNTMWINFPLSIKAVLTDGLLMLLFQVQLFYNDCIHQIASAVENLPSWSLSETSSWEDCWCIHIIPFQSSEFSKDRFCIIKWWLLVCWFNVWSCTWETSSIRSHILWSWHLKIYVFKAMKASLTFSLGFKEKVMFLWLRLSLEGRRCQSC